MKSFNALLSGLLAALMLSLVSCFDDSPTAPKDGACDAGKQSVTHTLTVDDKTEFLPQKYPLPAGKTMFYFTSGNKATFYLHYEQKNICPKEHLKVTFFGAAHVTQQPVPLNIYGEIVWSAVFPGAKGTLINGNAVGGYTKTVEAGLKQVFGEKPAEVDMYLNVEFDTQGSYAADVAYFIKHVETLTITFTADKHTK